MTNELVKANNLPMSCMMDIKAAGDILAQVDMLGAGNSAEGFIIAATCQQTGMSYLEFAETYNLVGGRPSKKADAMLARFNELGGEHVIIDRSPERAAVETTYNGKTDSFSLTWEEAKEEPFVYTGGPNAQLEQLKLPFEKRTLKNKYQTPRSRMQMLWARLVSDAVRCVCPKANKGCYTQDEIEDFADAKQVAGGAPVAADELAVDAISVTATVVDQDQPQPAQNQGPVVQGQGATPFQKPDYSVCPVPNCPLTGKLWVELTTEDLLVAVESDMAGVEQGHIDQIKAILKERGA